MKKITCLLLCISFLFSCKNTKENTLDDFDLIKNKGELTIITLNTSTSYFLYKEEPMGYDFDIAQDFCDHYGLRLNVKIANDVGNLLEMLANGEGDMIAYALPVTNELKDSIVYCGLEQISHQVLVQRANKGDTIINDVVELIGKEVHVEEGTKFHQRLLNLNAELGGGIVINTISKDSISSSEDLIEMVASGKIRYTINDEYIAKLNRTYFRNINVVLPISFDQRSSWAVGKNSPSLATALDEWFAANDNTPVYKSITKKYFELSKRPFEDENELPKDLPKGAISIYDDLFKKYAEGTKYEWQMLAAIAYQESRFKNNQTSWAGASGIMGLMPRTAKSLGLTSEDRMNPELAIGAAVELLGKLNKMFSKIENLHERRKFVLASYNGGNGHIFDAQALARKYGANPHVWEDNVKKYLELKSVPEYYEDSICKSGYFRASETTNYVRDVLANTERFKQISSNKEE